MNSPKTALLLIGSPRIDKSTSASLGNYLVSRLEEFGLISEKLFIYRIVNHAEMIRNLFQSIENADLIILTFPLYVDSIPAPVIKIMELIKENRVTLKNKKSQNFIAIVNSGFPEASQSSVALQICKIFSKESGFLWKGGLALGAGGAVNGAPLLERSGMLRNVIKGLDITAEALKDDKEIPQEAIDLFSKKFIPNIIYRSFGNLGWRIQARQYRGRQKLKAKPYLS
jgi:multimeric flavodoxin WrbA